MKLEYDVEADAAYIQGVEPTNNRGERAASLRPPGAARKKNPMCVLWILIRPATSWPLSCSRCLALPVPPSMRWSGRAYFLNKTPSAYCGNSVTNWSRRSVPDR